MVFKNIVQNYVLSQPISHRGCWLTVTSAGLSAVTAVVAQSVKDNGRLGVMQTDRHTREQDTLR